VLESDAMTKIEVESFSAATNAAVIRLPGRQFPGLLMQGDSLKILVDSVDDLLRLAGRLKIPELANTVTELGQILNDYKRVYEQALRQNNCPLPY
jgi:hypothetical protein